MTDEHEPFCCTAPAEHAGISLSVAAFLKSCSATQSPDSRPKILPCTWSWSVLFVERAAALSLSLWYVEFSTMIFSFLERVGLCATYPASIHRTSTFFLYHDPLFGFLPLAACTTSMLSQRGEWSLGGTSIRSQCLLFQAYQSGPSAFLSLCYRCHAKFSHVSPVKLVLSHLLRRWLMIIQLRTVEN